MKKRAGVFGTRRGGSGGGDSSDRRCRRGKNACAAPVAALSVLGVPPAVHPAVLQQHAGVFGTRGQGGGSDPRDSHWNRRIIDASRVAELLEVVPSPALHSAVPKKHAGVEDAGFERNSSGNSPDGYRRGIEAGRGGTGRLAPVADLTKVVPSPAAHRAVLKERAGVPAAG